MLMRHEDGREIVTANDDATIAAATAKGFEPVEEQPAKPKRKSRST